MLCVYACASFKSIVKRASSDRDALFNRKPGTTSVTMLYTVIVVRVIGFVCSGWRVPTWPQTEGRTDVLN